jgi:hypothetical protein
MIVAAILAVLAVLVYWQIDRRRERRRSRPESRGDRSKPPPNQRGPT